MDSAWIRHLTTSVMHRPRRDLALSDGRPTLAQMTAGGGFTGLDRWLRSHRWVPDALLAVVLAALLVPTSLPLVFDSSASASTKVVLAAAIIVAQTTVAFRRSRPAFAYLVCAVAMAVVVLTPPLGGLQAAGFTEPLPAILLPSSGVFLVLLYSVAAEGIGRIPNLALLVAGSAGLPLR